MRHTYVRLGDELHDQRTLQPLRPPQLPLLYPFAGGQASQLARLAGVGSEEDQMEARGHLRERDLP